MNYEDYDLVPEYCHGITGLYIRWHKILKLEARLRTYSPGPMILKFMMEE